MKEHQSDILYLRMSLLLLSNSKAPSNTLQWNLQNNIGAHKIKTALQWRVILQQQS